MRHIFSDMSWIYKIIRTSPVLDLDKYYEFKHMLLIFFEATRCPRNKWMFIFSEPLTKTDIFYGKTYLTFLDQTS